MELDFVRLDIHQGLFVSAMCELKTNYIFDSAI
jgi:hypothetical protein